MKDRLGLLFTVAISIAIGSLIAYLLQSSVIDFATVSNESMVPYLKPGDRLAVLKLRPCLRLPFFSIQAFCDTCSEGNIYVFRDPRDPKHRLVKYAARVPRSTKIPGGRGDIIWFTDHRTADQRLKSCYFLGTNAAHSIDSRHFGPIEPQKVEGLVIYPYLQVVGGD